MGYFLFTASPHGTVSSGDAEVHFGNSLAVDNGDPLYIASLHGAVGGGYLLVRSLTALGNGEWPSFYTALHFSGLHCNGQWASCNTLPQSMGRWAVGMFQYTASLRGAM